MGEALHDCPALYKGNTLYSVKPETANKPLNNVGLNHRPQSSHTVCLSSLIFLLDPLHSPFYRNEKQETIKNVEGSGGRKIPV